MRTSTILIILLLILQFPRSTAQDLYDINNITTIELDFFDDNWDALMDANYGTDNRVLATITINGTVLDSVGVKYKGNSSYNEKNKKNPMTIKLNHVISSQNYQGYDMLKLSNVFKDPSFVREALAYEIMRNYSTACQANFANVSIEGSLIGLYTSIEAVDDRFTEKNYGSKNRPMFKGEFSRVPGGCMNMDGVKRTWEYYPGADSSCYSYPFEIESPYGWGDVMNFLDIFNNHPNQMEEVLNVDRHLWTMAFQNLTVNLDASHNMGHNYYIYKDASERFNNILWDLNECFGVFQRLSTSTSGKPGTQSLTIQQLQQFDPFFQSTNENMPIMKRVMDISRYRKMYIAHLLTIMNENFGNEHYLERARAMQSIIDRAVFADPNKFNSYTDFKNNVTQTIGKYPGLQDLMGPRVTYISSLNAFKRTQPVISDPIFTPEIPKAFTSVDFSCKIDNANYAYLAYRHNIRDKFEKIELHDDGLHHDGTAGDGVYGTSVSLNATDIDYYIYAENNDIGAFSPARAEYEFYTLAVGGDLVLNEIMASNTTNTPDQNGEFDDWIELYNNASTPLSLDGYFLSDDASDLYKWSFPAGTVIQGNDYLIIWADKDTTQTGLHANFKLSASGESLYLSNASYTLLDELNYSAQTTDITLGRYPNGTGAYMVMNPTHGSENLNTPLSSEQIGTNKSAPFIYPNPCNNILNIAMNHNGTEELFIYNLTGTCIYQNRVDTNTLTIDVSNWSRGVYLIHINGHVKKLIIQ